MEFLAIFIPIMGNLDNYWNNRTQLPSNYQRYTTVSKHLDTKKYQNGYLIGQLLRFSSILRSVSLKQTACHLRCRERSGDKTRASSSPRAGFAPLLCGQEKWLLELSLLALLAVNWKSVVSSTTCGRRRMLNVSFVTR